MKPRRLHGLYAITDTELAADTGLLQQVEQALQGGARIIQYRNKGRNSDRRLTEATALKILCQRYEVPLIINDDIELALKSGADGVHLGRDDAVIQHARARLGKQAIVGISCYNDLARAESAQQAGADYLAFGRFFPSASKPGAVQAEIELLRQAKARFRLPLVAIGGVTPENGGQLIEAGADMLAVIQGVFAQPDIRAVCNQFKQLFNSEDI